MGEQFWCLSSSLDTLLSFRCHRDGQSSVVLGGNGKELQYIQYEQMEVGGSIRMIKKNLITKLLASFIF